LATEKAGVRGLADRYAAALFELAEERGELDGIAQDLSGLTAMLDDSPDLTRLVRSPILSRAEQAQAMAALLERAGAQALTRNFVALLAEKRRLFALAHIIEAFRAKLAAHRGEISAEVTSAAALKPAQLEAIKSALKHAVGRDVTLAGQIDPGLIGGLVVRVGSRMIDSSLRTKLLNLQLSMKEVG
jgi:F-type H+-transporting ATPase subunit delta